MPHTMSSFTKKLATKMLAKRTCRSDFKLYFLSLLLEWLHSDTILDTFCNYTHTQLWFNVHGACRCPNKTNRQIKLVNILILQSPWQIGIRLASKWLNSSFGDGPLWTFKFNITPKTRPVDNGCPSLLLKLWGVYFEKLLIHFTYKTV